MLIKETKNSNEIPTILVTILNRTFRLPYVLLTLLAYSMEQSPS
jgi:hypothetical protein